MVTPSIALRWVLRLVKSSQCRLSSLSTSPTGMPNFRLKLMQLLRLRPMLRPRLMLRPRQMPRKKKRRKRKKR